MPGCTILGVYKVWFVFVHSQNSRDLAHTLRMAQSPKIGAAGNENLILTLCGPSSICLYFQLNIYYMYMYRERI